MERLTASAAVLISALEQAGIRATLVGGGAIEFHAPGSCATTDIDLAVEGWPRDTIGRVLVSLGFKPHNRHWVLEDLFVEAPGDSLERRGVETIPLGSFALRVLKKEHVLADRRRMLSTCSVRLRRPMSLSPRSNWIGNGTRGTGDD